MSASDLAKLEQMVDDLKQDKRDKEDDKIHPSPTDTSSLCKEWKEVLDDFLLDAQKRYTVELQHEEDRRRESAAMRLPLRLLQRRMVLFVVGWNACYWAARIPTGWTPLVMAGVNAACLAAAHRLRAAPHGRQAFYSALVLSCVHVVTCLAFPPLWMVFAAGLIVEMCVDIDRCCQRYAWRQECTRLSELKRIDEPPLKVIHPETIKFT